MLLILGLEKLLFSCLISAIADIKHSVWQWLATGISNLAAEIGWILEDLSLEGARDLNLQGTKDSDTKITNIAKKAKLLLTIAGKNYVLIVSLIDRDSNKWKFSLQNPEVGGKIPPGFKLKLLDENGNSFENNENEAIEIGETEICVKAQLYPGEGLIWEIKPIPDNYHRQVMYF